MKQFFELSNGQIINLGMIGAHRMFVVQRSPFELSEEDVEKLMGLIKSEELAI